jgi:hypothetical protein
MNANELRIAAAGNEKVKRKGDTRRRICLDYMIPVWSLMQNNHFPHMPVLYPHSLFFTMSVFVGPGLPKFGEIAPNWGSVAPS